MLNKWIKIILHILGFLVTFIVFFITLFIGLQVNPGLANIFLGITLLTLLVNIVAVIPAIPNTVKMLCGMFVFGVFIYTASTLTSIYVADQTSVLNAYNLERNNLKLYQLEIIDGYIGGNDPAITEQIRQQEERREQLRQEVENRGY